MQEPRICVHKTSHYMYIERVYFFIYEEHGARARKWKYLKECGLAADVNYGATSEWPPCSRGGTAMDILYFSFFYLSLSLFSSSFAFPGFLHHHACMTPRKHAPCGSLNENEISALFIAEVEPSLA